MQDNTSQAAPLKIREYRRAEENRRNATYITIQQSAEYLGVTTRTIRQMLADNRLKGYSCGPRLVRLRRDEIDAAMQPFGGAAV